MKTHFFVVLSLLLMCLYSAAEPIYMGGLKVDLPSGYEHHKLNCIEYPCGSIIVKAGDWRISYDVGSYWLKEGLETYEKGDLATLIYFSKKTVGEIEYRYEIYQRDEKEDSYSICLRLPKQRINLYTEFLGKEHIKTLMDVFGAIKFQTPDHAKTK